MKLIINGQKRAYDNVRSLQDLISQISQKPEHVIAELNEKIVKRDNWTETDIKDGDTIELVTFVGGG